jgi:hypothetical protein
MSLINSVGFRTNYSHVWKYRNVLFFNKHSYNTEIKDLYFLSHFVQRLMDRKYFRKYDYYFSHLTVNRLNNRVLNYNLFFSSRFLRGIYNWFFKYFLVKLNRFFSTRKLKKAYVLKKRNLSFRTISLNYKNVLNAISFKIYFKIYKLVHLSLRSFYKIAEAYSNNEKVKLNFFVINENAISAYSLGSVFKSRLKKGSSLNRLVRSTFQLWKKGKYKTIAGFRIVCEGRFKRRQRAQHDVFSIGKIKTSSISSKVDYSLSTVYLKYGAGSIRIWLNYK